MTVKGRDVTKRVMGRQGRRHPFIMQSICVFYVYISIMIVCRARLKPISPQLDVNLCVCVCV